jgi:hypothetical protein
MDFAKFIESHNFIEKQNFNAYFTIVKNLFS